MSSRYIDRRFKPTLMNSWTATNLLKIFLPHKTQATTTETQKVGPRYFSFHSPLIYRSNSSGDQVLDAEEPAALQLRRMKISGRKSQLRRRASRPAHWHSEHPIESPRTPK